MGASRLVSFIKHRCGVILLIPVLALAYYIAFIPHKDYPYALHVDEWVHIANAEAVIDTGDLNYVDPFNGRFDMGIGNNLEIGYSVFLGSFQKLTGIDFMTISRYIPGLIYLITVLSVFIFAARFGFGLEGAFFAALLPTTVGILGPAFLVPVALAMFIVVLGLFLCFHLRGLAAALSIGLLVLLLIALHPVSAGYLALLAFPYGMILLFKDRRKGLGIILAIVLPIAIPFPWIATRIIPMFQEMLSYQPLPSYVEFPPVIHTYGIIIYAICLVGVFSLTLQKGTRSAGLLTGFLVLVSTLVAFYAFHRGIAIFYERGLLFMMLMTGIVAGAGLAAILKFRVTDWFLSRAPAWNQDHKWLSVISRAASITLVLALVTATLVQAIPLRERTLYYHLIDNEEYNDFIWIRDNLGGEYQVAVLDPVKAPAFTALTKKNVFTYMLAEPSPDDIDAIQFFEHDCSNTGWLVARHITIVYWPGTVNNPNLTEVRDNIYVYNAPD